MTQKNMILTEMNYVFLYNTTRCNVLVLKADDRQTCLENIYIYRYYTYEIMSGDFLTIVSSSSIRHLLYAMYKKIPQQGVYKCKSWRNMFRVSF